MSKQSIITGEVLLLCERVEMAQFMHAYLRHLFKQGISLPNMQIVNYQSIDKLDLLTKRLIQLEGREIVQKAVFFADAADERERRMQKFFAVRDNTFFRGVEYCTHFFFPGKKATKRWQKGYLEDMLLQSLRRESSECSDYYNLYNMSAEYLQSVNCCRGRENRLVNYSRHLLYTYLAGTERYVGMRLGEAALAGAFDLEHPCYASLKEYCAKVLALLAVVLSEFWKSK